jgi:plastocyanin
MPIISQLNTANTFSQWLTGTQDLITRTNSLVEGGSGSIFYSNTNLSVANNLTIGGDLTVSGNIVLDSISFDDINSNGSASFANNLSVTGNTTLTNVDMSGVLSVTGNTTLTNLAVSGSANISTLTSASGLLTSRTNIFVDGWALSSNANVRTGVTTFAVTNSGSGAYVFDQYSGNNPDIYLHPGQTVSFNINASGHPFLIRQSNGGTLYNVGLTHVSTAGVVTVGSDAQAKQSGTLIWKVPFALTGNTYVYQCQVHSGMVGNLIIQSTVTAALAAATAATGDSLAFAIALG